MAEQETNGLTLQGLASRLEALERENERIRSENAELWGEVSALRGSGTHREEVVTLRASETSWDGEVPATGLGGRVSRRSLLSKAGAAVLGAVAAGTLLNPREAKAETATFNHLSVVSSYTDAVVALTNASGSRGVWGVAQDGGLAGVEGLHQAAGVGVVGTGKAGYGGRFEGGKAQLLLIPDGKAGKPTTGAHKKGELYMDSAATLFVCTADGSPGTWREVATNPATNAARQSLPSDQVPSHGGAAPPPPA